jgi:hypothetical protein
MVLLDLIIAEIDTMKLNVKEKRKLKHLFIKHFFLDRNINIVLNSDL